MLKEDIHLLKYITVGLFFFLPRYAKKNGKIIFLFIPSWSRTASGCCQRLSLERATRSEVSETGGRLRVEKYQTLESSGNTRSGCVCQRRGFGGLPVRVNGREPFVVSVAT